jgi:hypothetical protein
MPKRYAGKEAKFCGNLWEQNKKKRGHLAPGDKIAHILPHNGPASILTR